MYSCQTISLKLSVPFPLHSEAFPDFNAAIYLSSANKVNLNNLDTLCIIYVQHKEFRAQLCTSWCHSTISCKLFPQKSELCHIKCFCKVTAQIVRRHWIDVDVSFDHLSSVELTRDGSRRSCTALWSVSGRNLVINYLKVKVCMISLKLAWTEKYQDNTNTEQRKHFHKGAFVSPAVGSVAAVCSLKMFTNVCDMMQKRKVASANVYSECVTLTVGTCFNLYTRERIPETEWSHEMPTWLSASVTLMMNMFPTWNLSWI